MRPRLEPGQRSETVRRSNLGAIVRELHAHGPLSRSELVARTGLTRSGIRRLVGELAAAGLAVEERGDSLGMPGRPSPLVALVPSSAVALAVEISVGSLGVAVVGLGGHVLHLVRVERRPDRGDVDSVVDDLVRLARSLPGGWLDREELAGIGVAIVGVVRRSDGYVSLAPNLGWRDVPLGAALRRAFGDRVPITVANEADLGALAEHRRGAALGASDVVFLSGDVGLGGGLIADGRPLVGAAGYGGEIGHVPVNPVDGQACRCGSVGCWETEVSDRRLLVRAGYPADSGPEAFEALLADAAAGREPARGAVEELGRWLGIGLAGLVNVLDPSLVVLGGRFARLHPLVAATIAAELDRRALAAPRALVRIVPATLGVDAPLVGAAELALEPVVADPAGWFARPDGLDERASA